MTQHNAIKIFEEKRVRTVWDDQQEKWYFSVVDVIEALTDSSDIRQYIKRLRQRDPELNSVWGTICTPHQFLSTDGKRHATNCVPTTDIRTWKEYRRITPHFSRPTSRGLFLSTSSMVYGKLRRSRSSHKSNSRFITHHSLTVFVIVFVFVQQRLFYRHRYRTAKGCPSVHAIK